LPRMPAGVYSKRMRSLRRESLLIPSGNIRLEAVCGYDPGTSTGPGVVICHPHPLMGGSMENNVVEALFEEFAARGFLALAFNFRGTGASGGAHEGGEGEIRDVQAALNWLGAQQRTRRHRLGVLGYSFGAWIGLQAAHRDPAGIPLAGAVAPPLGMLPFDFLSEYPGFLFFVLGDRDPYCPARKEADLLAGTPGRRQGRVIRGADHFFWNREAEAARFLCDRFLSALSTLAE